MFHISLKKVSTAADLEANTTEQSKQLLTTLLNLWPFLDLKIHQETNFISDLLAAQTKLSMKLVTQYALLRYSYFFTPPRFSDGKRKNSELFDRFRASISKFLPQAY